MKILLIFAMPEEAEILNNLAIQIHWQNYHGFQLAQFNYNQHQCCAIISGVGKSLSAAATAMGLIKNNSDLVINIGLAGGISCAVGDVIISQKALFHDADSTALGYEPNKLPDLPKIIASKEGTINLAERPALADFFAKDNIILTGDSFVSNYDYVNKLKTTYPDAKAIEMEAGSIAAICHKFSCPFIFIKKISDLADEKASTSFRQHINSITDKVNLILAEILS